MEIFAGLTAPDHDAHFAAIGRSVQARAFDSWADRRAFGASSISVTSSIFVPFFLLPFDIVIISDSVIGSE
ncbi:MAG: hypothetical protein M0Z91_07940 [Actinomycetota bacterium]|nr:hypothetical protein [Actinomycetota bacterium]